MGKAKGEPAPSESERALAEAGADRWNRFVSDLSPAIKQFVDLSRTSQSARRDIGAQASAEAARAGAGFRARGGQGASVAQAYDLSAAGAALPGTASASADTGLRTRENQSLMAASSIGRGVGDAGIDGLVAAGNRATTVGINDTLRATEMRQGLISAAATAAGAGAEWWMGRDPAGDTAKAAKVTTKPVPKNSIAMLAP